MARRSMGMNLDEQRVVVAVDFNVYQIQEVAAGLTLCPKAVA